MKRILLLLLATLSKISWFGKFLFHGESRLQEYSASYLCKDWQKKNIFGSFITTDGVNISLVKGLRDRVKPGWQSMLAPAPEKLDLPSRAYVSSRYHSWQIKVDNIEKFLNTQSLSLSGKRLMEVGVYDGVSAFALKKYGRDMVIATDMAAYYINQTQNGKISDEAVSAKNDELHKRRDQFRNESAGSEDCEVIFKEDDICDSSITSESMDVVLSWEVFEHIVEPEKALSEMYRILKPGGFMFHEYNPFFSIDGGHSLCTLDFLWGHARLNEDDFMRYLEVIRPAEKDLSLSFYKNNLNRMTIADLRRYLQEAGFTTRLLLPWPKTSHLNLLEADTLTEVVRHYPTACITDLISPTVWVLSEKKVD
jgi:SAM-dependent methyltransferase